MNTNIEKNNPIRLQVYLAHCGVASRRRAEEYIKAGRVLVNGTVCKEMGTKIVVGTDTVTFDGKESVIVAKHVYYALNKPPGYICSNSDPQGRQIARSLIPYTGRLYNVGRLDFMSSGLILFTNDGDFAFTVAHPSYKIEKEYIVRTHRTVSSELLERYKNGVMVEGVKYVLKDFSIHNPKQVSLVLIEGKNREIRNVFRQWRIRLKSIHRVRIGPVQLGSLKSGAARSISKRGITALLQQKYDNNY